MPVLEYWNSVCNTWTLEGTLQSQHPACFFPQHLCASRGHLCLGLIIIIPSWGNGLPLLSFSSLPFPHISLRYFMRIPNLLSLHDCYDSECKDFYFDLCSFSWLGRKHGSTQLEQEKGTHGMGWGGYPIAGKQACSALPKDCATLMES